MENCPINDEYLMVVREGHGRADRRHRLGRHRGELYGRRRPDAAQLGVGLRHAGDGRVFVRARRRRQQRPALVLAPLRRLLRPAGHRQGKTQFYWVLLGFTGFY